jgi:hypothetical protein
MAVGTEKRFFHWFLEFPEVMKEGGFDCILGNPPFLGGQRLSGTFGDNFLNWVKTEYTPAGSCDLVTYFFRRIFELLKSNGFQSLISTNTIAQGNARDGGLDVMLAKGGKINFAVRSMRWPGAAAGEVALVAVHKGKWSKERTLGNKRVNFISSYLDDTNSIGNPYPLKQNENKSFQGSIVLGKGFILEPNEAARLIAKNPKNKDVLFPYLNGEDLNTNPDQGPSRWGINFFDWDEDYCRNNYPDCFDIVERLVKPERSKLNDDNSTNKNRKNNWWLFGSDAKTLYRTIAGMEKVLVISEVTKYCSFSISSTDLVFMHTLKIVASSSNKDYSLVNSSLHEYWAWKYSSTMGGNTLRYILDASFETFPFPKNSSKESKEELEEIGEKYHEFRRQLMADMQLGLTKTYNLFHDPECNLSNIEKAKEIREFKQSNLQIPLEEAIQRIEKLRELHKQMDEAVLKAYGWSEDSPLERGLRGVSLAHNFYEVDYLPENDRIRYTISPEARKEILKRLLELNHKIHDEEVKTGLWEKKGKKKIKIPAGNENQGGLF